MEKNTTMFNKKYLVVFIVLLVALMTVSVAADVTNTNTKAKVTKNTKVTNTQKIVKTTENTKKIKTNNNITNSKTKTEVKKNTTSKKVKKEANMADVYVSPDVTTAQEGTQNNPTTISDALTKIADDATIHLQKGSTGLYPITQTITISSSTIPTGITKLTIRGDNVTLDGQKTTQIMNIESSINLNIENITFKNGYTTGMGSAISTKTANLTLNNVNCYDNVATYSTIFVQNVGGCFYLKGTNNFINNTQTNYGTITIVRLQNLNVSGQNLFKDNSGSMGGALIVMMTDSKIEGTNTFINNTATQTGGALYLRGNSTIAGTNTFINNSANQGADIFHYSDSLKIEGNTQIINSIGKEGTSINHYGMSEGEISVSNITFKDINAETSIISTGSEGSYVYENNTFINCSSSKYSATNNGKGSLLTFSGNIIFKNNKFFNCSTNQTIVHPYVNGGATEISNNTFENILSNETIIYSQRKFNTIADNSFTNCNSRNETIMIVLLEFHGSNQQITDNTFINSTIKTNYTIELNENNPNPIRVQDKVNILIKDLVVANPDFYDSDVLEKTDICYEVYNNDELITITENVKDNFNFTPTTTGEYQITTKSNLGSTSQNTLTFNVEEKLIETEIIAIAPTENPVNKSTPITIQLLDENGELVSNAKINMTNGDKTEEIELPLGIAVIQYTPTTIGEETITFIFEGIGTVQPSQKELTITVTEDKDQIIEELNQTVQEQSNTIEKLEENVTDLTNKQEEANKVITQQQNTINNLNNTVETQKQDIQKLEETVEKTTTKTKTTITVDKVTTNVGKTVTIKATVKDANGKAVTSGKVSLKVNGVVLKDSSDNTVYADVNKGTATINYVVPASWMKKGLKVEAFYIGDNKYQNNNKTTTDTIKVNKGSSKITLTPNIKTLKAGQKVIINVKQVDSNTKQGLTSTVTVKVNGKTYKVKVKNGEGKVTYTVPKGTEVKTIKVTATHSDNYYNKTTSKTSFKVTKTTPTIKTTKTTYKSKKTTIKGKILDANNKVLTKNVKVTVKVDGKVVLKNKVVKKGKINLSFKKSLKKGYHELVITSKATKAFTDSKLITVLKV